MLTEQEQALLGIWQRWPQPSERDRRVNAFRALGLSEVRATQVVNALVGRPEAWEVDPVTVKRLSRLRSRAVPSTRRAAPWPCGRVPGRRAGTRAW